MGNMERICRGHSLGSPLDRYTGLLHAGLCCCRDDSNSGVGNDPASGQSVGNASLSVRTDGNIAASSSVNACADTWRVCGLAFLPETAGLFITRNNILHVYISPPSKGHDEQHSSISSTFRQECRGFKRH